MREVGGKERNSYWNSAVLSCPENAACLGMVQAPLQMCLR